MPFQIFSMPEFHEYLNTNVKQKTKDYLGKCGRGDPSWDLGVSGVDALRLSIHGDSRYVGRATAHYDLMVNTVGSGLVKRQLPSLVGSTVCVPAYLGGSPRAMRRRVHAEGQPRHVRIYCLQSTSCCTQASTMETRGIAILSLLQLLQAMQVAVDLYLVSDCAVSRGSSVWSGLKPGEPCDQKQCSTTIVQVETTPLSISQSGFAVGHPAWTRHLLYAPHIDEGFSESGPPTLDNTASGGWASPLYAQAFKARMKLQPTDIVIPGASDVTEYSDEFIKGCLRTAGVLNGPASEEQTC